MPNNPAIVNHPQVPLLDALKTRYATKKFDPARRIPADLWETLEESLVLTPSSFGLQAWQFLIVENPALRSELRAVSWGQAQPTDASHLVVFTARTSLDDADVSDWIERLAEIQGTPLAALAPLKAAITGFIHPMSQEQRHEWNRRQVYIALGQFMTAAAILGIDTCPLEGIDAAAYDRILGLENSGYTTSVACAAGYRADDDRHAKLPKARYHHSRLIRRL
jgi:nitroreductase